MCVVLTLSDEYAERLLIELGVSLHKNHLQNNFDVAIEKGAAEPRQMSSLEASMLPGLESRKENFIRLRVWMDRTEIQTIHANSSEYMLPKLCSNIRGVV